MPRQAGSAKTGGRQAGTPNKATRALKAFLERVFEKAFADPKFEAELVLAITTLKLDPAVLRTLLAYYAGTPTKQVDHKHSGTVSLEQIIAGTATTAAAADEDDEDIDE